MNARLSGASAALAFAVIAGTAIAAQSAPDLGKREYYAKCMTCHGMRAKGDGPLRTALHPGTPDLTVLARHNNGVFPTNHVLRVVDGRQDVKVYGHRDMPVWGDEYRRTAVRQRAADPEAYASERVAAVTAYLSTLQAR